VTTDHQVASLFFVKKLWRGPAGYALCQPSQEAKHSLTGITHTRGYVRDTNGSRVVDDQMVRVDFDIDESVVFPLPHG
jgi:hypothetical protein